MKNSNNRLLFVTGGSGSGKSAFAERQVVESGLIKRIYLATMQPFGEEGARRIRRHREMRKGKDFLTAERPTDLAGLDVPEGSAVLLEDLTNLFANEWFSVSPEGARERKLEILKDSHTGAFAIICCCLYLLALLVFWREAEPAPGIIGVVALMPVLSRAMSGFFAASLPNARGSGLLASFTQPMDGKKARVILLLWVFAAALVMGLCNLWLALWALGGAFLAALYYVRMSRREFGGITGDLAGFFLQVAECAMVLFLVLGQKVGGLLWF